MLLGCTVTLMHWPMLPANRYGSSARSQLSLGEHLQTWAHVKSTESTLGRCHNSPRCYGGQGPAEREGRASARGTGELAAGPGVMLRTGIGYWVQMPG